MVSAAGVITLVLTAVLVGLNPGPAPAQPRLATGPGWVRGWRPGDDAADDEAWLARGTVPGEGRRWQPMVRAALLDLHRLIGPGGAVAAGPVNGWNYVWPRDTAFVAAALAHSGHVQDAEQALRFLQRVRLRDGGFQARYRLDGSGPPDQRLRQSDGAGWALWSLEQVSRVSGRSATAESLRPLLDDSTRFVLAATDDGRRLPSPSPDYWEVPVSRTSLGTVAPLLAGLRASQRLYASLGETAAAQRSGTAADRLAAALTWRFGGRFERFGQYGGLDAAVCFLMPPFTATATPAVQRRWNDYQDQALRPAGGLAPGTAWRLDGISWTPETSLVAYTAAMSGRTRLAEHWMDWLQTHRTSWGSLPEKVLGSGAPAGPAPLAWTSALVVLTAAGLPTGTVGEQPQDRHRGTMNVGRT
ncbi:MAG TPA: glycoside hydrolase family 15 [Oryzihumus sp.]|nr:glycoside hydrolase family 15 [Oryzihumus sp.]